MSGADGAAARLCHAVIVMQSANTKTTSTAINSVHIEHS